MSLFDITHHHMIEVILVGGFVLCVAYYWYTMRSAERRLNQMLEASEASLAKPSYRCVKIEIGQQACSQVKVYQAKPILVNDAPRLPLADCNVGQCDCKFLRFDDRRSGEDRRDRSANAVMNAKIYADKRIRKDRRKASINHFLKGSTKSYSHGI